MYTGYFPKLKKYIARQFTPVSIALYTPKWYKGIVYLPLAPNYNLLNRYKYKSISENEFIIEYNQQLNKLNPIKVRQELSDIDRNLDNIVLLCYEKPTDFCHRKLAVEWLYRNKIIDFYEELNI